MVQVHSRQKVLKTPPQPKKAGCSGVHVSSLLVGNINRRIMIQAGQGKSTRSYLKNITKTRATGRHKALSSNPSTAKKRKKSRIFLALLGRDEEHRSSKPAWESSSFHCIEC
jgi:hypothetical protein